MPGELSKLSSLRHSWWEHRGWNHETEGVSSPEAASSVRQEQPTHAMLELDVKQARADSSSLYNSKASLDLSLPLKSP